MNYEQNNGNNYPNTTVEYNYNTDPVRQNNYYTAEMPLSYHIKRFLIGLLLAVVIIFLLVWIFPTKAGLKNTIEDSISDAFDKSFAEKLNPLYDRIFGDNINTMKEVAIAYFTTERLPKAEGETKKLTLGEMLDMKLLLDIKDKNGKMCDRDKSYVEITKMSNEYKLKVNLSCGDEEDYIVTYLGCYNYCLNDVCEKRTSTQAKKQVIKTNNGSITNTIKKVVKPEKHYCEIYNGKYYGSTGKTVSKSTYQKQCTHQPEKHYCAVVNGKYYGKKGNVVSKSTYKKECLTPEKHYCEVINGKYWGKHGVIVSKEDYKKQCESPEDVYKYLYEKIVTIHHEKEYSEWTDWSGNIEYNPNDNNINWGKHEFDWYEKVGYKLTKYYEYTEDKNQPIYNTYYDRLLGYKTQYACGGYTYYIDTTTNTTYTSTGNPGTGWTKTGRVTLSYKPDQSSTKRYVYVGMNYDHCAATCTLKPYYIFDVYTRNPGSVATSKVSSSKTTVSAVCNNVVETKIPMYGKRTEFAGYVTNRELKEKRTYYYHKKTRTLIKDAYTDTKKYQVWSLSKHDESLISQGYKYTGIYEKIN